MTRTLPVLFLWRHHLELQLKGVIRAAALVLDRGAEVPRQHRLPDLWTQARNLVEEAFRHAGERLPLDEAATLGAALRQLSAADPKSMAFRYPEDLQAQEHLPGVRHINYANVEAHMRPISDALACIDMALWQFADWKRATW